MTDSLVAASPAAATVPAPATPAAVTGGHLVPLPGTEWTVWRDAVLRTAGFPAAGLDRFAAPGCAAVADAFLDGDASEDDVRSALAAATAAGSETAADIAADPLFQEALTWQNPAARLALSVAAEGGAARAGTENSRERKKRRVREDAIALYWQRYCGKNDTIGFFGPVTWVRLDPAGPAATVWCGDQLVRNRETGYEFWLLETYARGLAADPLMRPWLPVGMHPDLTLEGCRVLRPGQPPLELTGAEARLLRRCDGRTPAMALTTPPHQADGLALLAGLAARDVVWWGIDMPYNPEAERVLRATLAAIPDAAARERSLAGLRRMDAARDAVTAAAGDPGALAAAISRLDAEFTAVTGADPQRRPGQMYAGRRLCFEDTVRDIELAFGRPVLEALAGPLSRVLLPVARWASGTLAAAFDQAFRSLYEELRAPGESSVPMTSFWEAAQGLFTGAGKPVDAVAATLAERWQALFGLGRLAPGTRRVTVASDEVAALAAELFPPLPPRWPAARIHSPDLHICAPSTEALNRGEFTVVLGELHIGWPTLDCAVFTDRHPDPASLIAAAAADIGPQFRPLYPTWWPRYTGRIAPNLGVTDHQLAFTHAPGADPARVIAITALTVTDRDGTLTAVARDGRSWPVLDVFALLVAWSGLEALKQTSAGPHSPRITVDRLVVARETWRITIGASGLTVANRLPEYLAARRLRRGLGLPDKLFAKVSTEIKPVYLDLTSPRYLSAFCTMLRSTQQKSGDGVEIAFTEMLPGAQDAWVPDASGQRYFSELRIQLRDPMAARDAGKAGT
ncbi:MAG TPA: lantibiotic dehydratase [Streptosporangiaceae bacterium]